MWERTLQDLIRGLRANKSNESKFIASAIDEIRKEVRSDDMELKAAAVLKLTYLEMMGYNMSWASFHVVEVMSSPRFHLKSMGYLAATQSFEQDTDVLMLTTNLLKKDMTSADSRNVAVSLNGLSHIVTPDLGRDLSRDLITLLTHSRSYVRKRAVLALYRVFLKYPEALDIAMERLKERLEDPDSGVVCATVNVLCELAKQHPQTCLPFAPPLFHILTTSSNNWMLIKIIKLFGLLAPLEPRLIKKLQPPITDLISTTPAISLLYECVHTCIIGGMLSGTSGYALAKTCVTKLAGFLSDSDQNLKYIALLALTKIVPTHPHLVADYEVQILESINDADLSIRMRALDLLSAMVNENNLQSIVQQLLSMLAESTPIASVSEGAAKSLEAAASSTKPLIPTHSSPAKTSAAYRETIARRILSLCASDLYANVTDFQWYISVLVDVAYVAHVPVGAVVRDQLVDVVARVRQVRSYAVQISMRILEDDVFYIDDETDSSSSQCREVLWAAAWICGEYGSEFPESQKVIGRLVSESSSTLAPDVVAMFIQSAGKIFGAWAAELASNWDEDDLSELRGKVETIIARLRAYTGHANFEVQERAAEFLQLFKFIQADLASYRTKQASGESSGFADETTSAFDPIGVSAPSYPKSLLLLQPLFSSYDLNPVAPEAQGSIQVPEGLDLDTWIVPEAQPPDPEALATTKRKKDRKGKGKERETGKESSTSRKSKKKKKSDIPEMSQEQIAEAEAIAAAKARRMEELRDDPYYIMDDQPKQSHHVKQESVDLDSIPVVRLDDLPPLHATRSHPQVPTPSISPMPSLFLPTASTPSRSFTVDRGGEMPPGSVRSSTPSVSESKIGSLSTTPVRSEIPSMATSTVFQPYQVNNEDLQMPSTPEPIKVKSKKKKRKHIVET